MNSNKIEHIKIHKNTNIPWFYIIEIKETSGTDFFKIYSLKELWSDSPDNTKYFRNIIMPRESLNAQGMKFLCSLNVHKFKYIKFFNETLPDTTRKTLLRNLKEDLFEIIPEEFL